MANSTRDKAPMTSAVSWVKKAPGRAMAWSKKRPMGVAIICAGCLLVAVAAFGLTRVMFPNSAEELAAEKSLAELKGEVAEDPKDATSQVALGHAYFMKDQKRAGLRAYERALALDEKSADDQMLKNLVSCFGYKVEQPEAAVLIVRHKLAGVEPHLDDLAKHERYLVRWGAINTLEKLGKDQRVDHVAALKLDLAEKDCKIRRRAVEELGKIGDRRSLDAIRAAKKKDDDDTSWYESSCLGDRAKNAEKQILARK